MQSIGQLQRNGTTIMKIDWKGEAAAATAAFALTGVAMWGSILPLQAVPMMPEPNRPQTALVQANSNVAELIREGDYA